MLSGQFEQLSRWLDKAGIGLLELTGPGTHLRLERGRTADPCQHAANSADGRERDREIQSPLTVRAPIAGTLLLKHPMHDTPLADRGRRLDAGQTVALLQIGPLLVSVTTPEAGIVADVLGQDGSLIGFGTEILRLARTGSQNAP
jgi:acetyl-CoA carboxylase biotin carboxyl carrier protein